MTTTIQETDERIIAILSGELDTAAAAKTEKDLQPQGSGVYFLQRPPRSS